jgi:hypothetical protein
MDPNSSLMRIQKFAVLMEPLNPQMLIADIKIFSLVIILCGLMKCMKPKMPYFQV